MEITASNSAYHHMDVGQIVLLVVDQVHAHEDSVEHRDDWHRVSLNGKYTWRDSRQSRA